MEHKQQNSDSPAAFRIKTLLENFQFNFIQLTQVWKKERKDKMNSKLTHT